MEIGKSGSIQSDAKIWKPGYCLTGIHVPLVSNCDEE